MFVAGTLIVRNESLIIRDTLDHWAQFCDSLYIYDDRSTDDTPDICEAHPAVKAVQRGTVYDGNRARALMTSHNYALDLARPDNPDWIIQPDADERIDELPEGWETSTGVIMKLFDFYITEEDVDLRYDERKWLGPEYREILMMYRYTPTLRFEFHDQRIMRLRGPQKVLRAGYVRHYGKAISIGEWERTCDYYAEEWPEPYATKWKNRRGQAVHSISDWGRPLIQWDERDLYGVRL